MTRKEQNKVLHAKFESNANQYKVDRLNAEISAFSSGDLNKYEFLKRIDLNYKPNALDKARFEFSPLGRAFNEGLDKTIPNYQEEGVIKLLKEIRDNLAVAINIPAGLAIPPGPPNSSSLPPGPPSSPSLTNVTSLSPQSSPGSSSLINVTSLFPPSSPGSSSLTNVTPLSTPGSSKKTRTVRPRSKSLLSDGQKLLYQIKLETSQRTKISPPVIPIMSKTPISKIFQSHETDSDGSIKKLKRQNKQKHEQNKLLKKQKDELNKLKKKTNKQTKKDTDLDDAIKKLKGRNKLLKQQKEQNKLLEQQDEQNKILKKQQDELNTKNKQEGELNKLLENKINETHRKANELTKNIKSKSAINFRTFASRRDPFDDINKKKKN